MPRGHHRLASGRNTHLNRLVSSTGAVECNANGRNGHLSRKWSDLSGIVGTQQKVAPHCIFVQLVTLGSSGDAQVSTRFGGLYSLRAPGCARTSGGPYVSPEWPRVANHAATMAGVGSEAASARGSESYDEGDAQESPTHLLFLTPTIMPTIRSIASVVFTDWLRPAAGTPSLTGWADVRLTP